MNTQQALVEARAAVRAYTEAVGTPAAGRAEARARQAVRDLIAAGVGPRIAQRALEGLSEEAKERVLARDGRQEIPPAMA